MKLRINRLKALYALFFLVLLTGCIRDKVSRQYTIQSPVFASKASVLANIKASPARPIDETGKIYWYGKWIFLNEPGRGIHIIDNTNPASPSLKAFIELPGTQDIAVKGNILYADLFTDMLAIDISNPLVPILKKKLDNIFPDRQYVAGYHVDSSMVIVDWVSKDTIVDAGTDMWGLPGFGCVNCFTANTESGGSKSNTGQGGSMARFAIVNEYLYTVSESELSTISISTEYNPVKLGSKPMGWGIETVYPFRDKLFIGSATGMFIADISNQAEPVLMGGFSHARACDPVVADDKYAYVTLRTGNACTGTQNQLDIVDVSNLSAPSLVKTYPMTNPHGLGIRGNHIYLCDGRDGLKVLDASNTLNIQLQQKINISDAFDVIVNQDLLLLVAGDGLYQFRIAEDGKLSQISSIKTN